MIKSKTRAQRSTEGVLEYLVRLLPPKLLKVFEESYLVDIQDDNISDGDLYEQYFRPLLGHSVSEHTRFKNLATALEEALAVLYEVDRYAEKEE